MDTIVEGNDYYCRVYRQWLQCDTAIELLTETQKYLENNQFQQLNYQYYGKVVPAPRLNLAFGDQDIGMNFYSGTSIKLLEWPKILKAIKNTLINELNIPFNSCLINLYKDEHSSIGEHFDREVNPHYHSIVVTISVGQTRRFIVRNKSTKQKYVTNLNNGDLCIMFGNKFQDNFTHEIPKEKYHCNMRLSYTFRVLQ